MSVSSIPVQGEEKPKPRFIFLEKNSVIDAYESFGKEGFGHLLSGGYVNNFTEQVLSDLYRKCFIHFCI